MNLRVDISIFIKKNEMFTMKIIIASDSFKGSLSSQEVNNIIANTIEENFTDIEILKINIADGGEGTLDAIINVCNCEIKETIVNDALVKNKIKVKWALINNKRDAIFEVASIVGLYLLKENERNPLFTTTYGIGELILHILDYNVENIYIGLGGSSTNDAGTGALKALGIKFLDVNNKEIQLGGINLLNLNKIDISNINKKVLNTNFILLSDVDNVLCGNNGASYIFGPQKGASLEDIKTLDNALQNFQNILKKDFNIDISTLKGGGAAGGIGAGFKAFLKSEIKSGIKTILELINFENIIKDSDFIITGEGKIDYQTKYGKAIKGISDIAKKHNKPVFAFCGIIDGDKEILCNQIGLKNIFPVVNNIVSLENSIKNPNFYLSNTVRNNIDKLFI